MINHPSFRSLFERLSRRDALRVVAGTGLSFLLPTLNLKAADERGPKRPKSLITLWMSGGPSQLETWDPHPNSRSASSLKAIKTTVSGLEICELMPRMAEQLHDLSVIRSLVSKEGDHERGTYFVQTGYRPDPTVVHPAMSAVITRFKPNNDLEIPAHIALGNGNANFVPRGGYLGAELDAFRITNPGGTVSNMRSNVDDKRQQRRLEGLDVVTKAFRQGRPQQVDNSLHQHVVKRALTMMSSSQLKAFEFGDETKQTKERYGDSNFGRGCLIARRLVEQGVRAVQVSLPGFDTHINNLEGQTARINDLDPAFAALMQDLRDRDLLESTIVLCIGEFGRTPWLNALEGRDHWPMGFSCVIGGGGLQSGLVIGETNPDTSFNERNKKTAERKKPADPIEVPDLYATILAHIGLDPEEELMTPIGRPLKLSEGTPIERLLKS